MSTGVVPIKKNEVSNNSEIDSNKLNELSNGSSNLKNENNNEIVEEMSLDIETSDSVAKSNEVEYKTYIVGRYGSGEKFTTLWSISQDSGVSIEEIKKANPSIGANNVIHPGQEIIVPIKGFNDEETYVSKNDKSSDNDESGQDAVIPDITTEDNSSSSSVSDIPTTNDSSSIDLSKYSNTPLCGNFELTTGNKTYHDMSLEDTLEVAAVIYAEAAAGIKPDDALAVASVIANRVEYVRADTGAAWGGYQQGMQEVVSASGQFSTYGGSSYNEFLTNYRNGIITERMQMCLDVLEDVKNGVRNNDYQAFRSSGSVSYSDNRVVEGGNRYKVTARA